MPLLKTITKWPGAPATSPPVNELYLIINASSSMSDSRLEAAITAMRSAVLDVRHPTVLCCRVVCGILYPASPGTLANVIFTRSGYTWEGPQDTFATDLLAKIGPADVATAGPETLLAQAVLQRDSLPSMSFPEEIQPHFTEISASCRSYYGRGPNDPNTTGYFIYYADIQQDTGTPTSGVDPTNLPNAQLETLYEDYFDPTVGGGTGLAQVPIYYNVNPRGPTPPAGWTWEDLFDNNNYTPNKNGWANLNGGYAVQSGILAPLDCSLGMIYA